MSQMIHQIEVTQKLRFIFLFNAFGTGFIAIALLLFANEISKLSGIDNVMIIRLVGLASIIPSIIGFWAAIQKKCRKFLLLLLAFLCEIWVLGSIFLIYLVPLTTIGTAGIILVDVMAAGIGGFLYYFYVAR